MKLCSNDAGHMTKMACMPIYMYGKNLKNLLLYNQKARLAPGFEFSKGKVILLDIFY